MKKPMSRYFRRSTFVGFLRDQQMWNAFLLSQNFCSVTHFHFQATSRYITSYIHKYFEYISLAYIADGTYLKPNNLHSTHNWLKSVLGSNALNPANITPRPSNRRMKYICVLRWIDRANRSRHCCVQALNCTGHLRPTALPCNHTKFVNF